MRTDLSLFDLDHTLLDGDSNALWLAWLVEQGAAPAERLLRQAAFYAQYKAGSLDIDLQLDLDHPPGASAQCLGIEAIRDRTLAAGGRYRAEPRPEGSRHRVHLVDIAIAPA